MVATPLRLDHGMSLPAAGFGRLKNALGSVKDVTVNVALSLVTEKHTLENIVGFEAMGNYLAHTYKIQLGDEPLAWVSKAENALDQERYSTLKKDLEGVVLARGNSYYQFNGSSLAPYLNFTPTEIRTISFKKLGLMGLGFSILGMSGCNFFQSEPEPAPTVSIPPPTPDIAAIAGDAVYDGNVLTLSGRIDNLSSEYDAKNIQVELRVNGNGHQIYPIPSIPKNDFFGVSFTSTGYKPGDEVVLVALLDNDPISKNNTADYKGLIKTVNNNPTQTAKPTYELPKNTPPPTDPTAAPNLEQRATATPRATPTATPPPTPDIAKLPVYTPDEFFYFKNATGLIEKWRDKDPIYVRFFGSAADKNVMPSAQSIQYFKDGAAAIEKATNGNLSFRYTPPTPDAPVLDVYLDVLHSDLYELFPKTEPWRKIIEKSGAMWHWDEFASDNYIKKGKIVVPNRRLVTYTDLPGERLVTDSPEDINFSVKHELINVTGAGNDQVEGPKDSALNDATGMPLPQNYSPLDLKVLEILYLPGVKPHADSCKIVGTVIRVDQSLPLTLTYRDRVPCNR